MSTAQRKFREHAVMKDFAVGTRADSHKSMLEPRP
jgi:hypothetical protein